MNLQRAIDRVVNERNSESFDVINGAQPRKSSSLINQSRNRLYRLVMVVVCSLASYFVVCAAVAGGHDTFADGRRAYDFGEYAVAQRIWAVLANTGDIKSQSSLAYLYREGKGVARNSKVAAYWYYKAALHDEPTAQSALCDMHLHGEGVPRDLKSALFWCELSIANGEASGIEYREKALNRISAQERDEVWRMISNWRALHRNESLTALQAE
jgi:TPR repeat protein